MKTANDFFLAGGMLITGSVNTLSTKWADTTKAVGRGGGDAREFNHPFFQATGMFVGESLCMITFLVATWWYKRKGEPMEEAKKFSPLIFVLPACCDMTATSLMYIGLTMTDASIFQMLRGSVVIFTSILSVIFLGRKLRPYHWFSVFLILLGVFIVGLASTLANKGETTTHHNHTNVPAEFQGCGNDTSKADKAFLGNILIVAAQFIAAIQMCVEEKFVGGYNIPALQAVGWEGIWGFTVLCSALVVMNFIPDNSKPTCKFEDARDAFTQMGHSAIICIALFGNVMSIAFFNYFGISVTKVMSASHRMVLDSVRTFVIWGVSLLIGWESFYPLQLLGFCILIAGTATYNDIVRLPYFEYDPVEPDIDDEAFMDDPKNIMGDHKFDAKRSFTTVEDIHRGSGADYSALYDKDEGGNRKRHGSQSGSFLGASGR